MKLKFLIPAAAVVLLSGCNDEPVVYSKTEQIEISLSWWGNDVRNEYTIEAVNRFEELHPEIKVNCSYSEWSGYQSRYSTQMVSNTEADVMQINYAWIQEYSPNGDGYYNINKLSSIVDLTNFTGDELDYGIQDGKLNAVPIALNTQTMYINKTIYDNYSIPVPETWDDLFNAAEIMNGKAYPLSMTSKSSWFFIIAYAEQVTGKQFMTIDGKLNFNSDDIQIMLEFYKKLVEEKVIPQVEYFERLEIESGNYAGTVAWLSDASNYCDGAVENGYEIITADYPHTPDTTSGTGWYAKPATMYAVSKNTSYPEESALLLDFLLNSPEMSELQGTEKGIPLSTSFQNYLKENNMLEGMQYKAFTKMNEYSDTIAVISPYFENTDLIDEFRDGCNAVLYDKMNSADKAQELYNRFSEILSESGAAQ